MARQQWEKVRFSESLRTYEDIDEVLERILVARKRMVLTGQMVIGRPETERRELQDLDKKVPKGTNLRLFIYTIAGPPESFRQWFERCQRYAAGLPRRSNPEVGAERHRMAAETPVVDSGPLGEGEEEESEEDQGEDLEPWAEEDAYPPGEGEDKGFRMNDFRQAAGGLRRPKARVKPKPRPAGAAGAPFCRVCNGRHRVWPCPNVVAKKDANFNSEAAATSGAKCFFQDPKFANEPACGGVGHLARHHQQAEAEASAARVPAVAAARRPPGATTVMRGPYQGGPTGQSARTRLGAKTPPPPGMRRIGASAVR
ncbi:MAG: hypothetical protein GY772_08430, partial [bacterium]|nr:hypothetical protein [bacterium]